MVPEWEKVYGEAQRETKHPQDKRVKSTGHEHELWSPTAQVPATWLGKSPHLFKPSYQMVIQTLSQRGVKRIWRTQPYKDLVGCQRTSAANSTAPSQRRTESTLIALRSPQSDFVKSSICTKNICHNGDTVVLQRASSSAPVEPHSLAAWGSS